MVVSHSAKQPAIQSVSQSVSQPFCQSVNKTVSESVSQPAIHSTRKSEAVFVFLHGYSGHPSVKLSVSPPVKQSIGRPGSQTVSQSINQLITCHVTRLLFDFSIICPGWKSSLPSMTQTRKRSWTNGRLGEWRSHQSLPSIETVWMTSNQKILQQNLPKLRSNWQRPR